MRRSREDTAETRVQAVAAASRLARQKGLDAVSIGEVMQEVGRTVGAFYRHFPTKEALLIEACQHMFDDFQARRAERFGAAPTSVDELVSRYLSEDHRDHAELGCPVPTLLSTVGSQSPEIRETFTTAVRARLSKLEELNGPGDQDLYFAAVSAMFGALALSRAINDQEFSSELLMRTARHLIKSLHEIGS